MKRLVAVCLGSLCLSASAGETAPKPAAQKPAAQKPAAQEPSLEPSLDSELPLLEPPDSSYKVTLENLDKYISYRRESDERLLGSMQQIAEELQQPGESMMSRLKKLHDAEVELSRKHGLAREDFQKLDRLVNDIIDSRFTAESPIFKAMLAVHEKNAAAGEGQQQELSRTMVKFIKQQMKEGPTLKAQRQQYGEANVALVLRREKELKVLWERKQAAAAKALEALPELQ